MITEVTEETVVTNQGIETTKTETTADGTVVTHEVVTTEVVAVNEETGEELVKVVDTVEVNSFFAKFAKIDNFRSSRPTKMASLRSTSKSSLKSTRSMSPPAS